MPDDQAGRCDGNLPRKHDRNVLRPAFQIIRTKPEYLLFPALFNVYPYAPIWRRGVVRLADCAVNPNPSAPELAEIALSSAETAQALAGVQPKVAMLSFSTKGSASHELVDKVTEAVKCAQKANPDLLIDGELQADAAIVPSVGKSKAPGSNIAGQANVLVFPDLQSGNIAYKLVERISGTLAIGPILQGMVAPVNDLSRGCRWKI